MACVGAISQSVDAFHKCRLLIFLLALLTTITEAGDAGAIAAAHGGPDIGAITHAHGLALDQPYGQLFHCPNGPYLGQP